MGDRSQLRPAFHILAVGVALALLGVAAPAFAAHDLGQDCYTCHNIKSGQVYQGSYSIWSGLSIGMSPYSRPITCEVCHTDYGDRFKATSASHHPVAVIAGATMNSSYDNGVQIRCRDCHNGNSVTTLTPNLIPDLAPTDYLSTAGNTATDGYPNHDVLSPNNLVNPGDPPHLLSMLLSGGQRTVNGSDVYNKVPSSSPATDYAFCLACHDGSANTARAVNVKQDYIDKGHYFKTTGGGITAGDRIPCSDCHASHNSPTNARLFEPDNTTWTGPRPSGLTFASPYAPTAAEYRAVCIFCHEDYNSTNTVTTTKRVRGVAPVPRKWGITGHAATDTQSCKQCHNPHKTPGGGPDCLTCHTPGGAAGTAYDYIDALFKGVGSDNTATQPASVGSLTWSQHGGFVSVGGAARFLYASPYNTKASNDCFKCHGDRHNNTYALIDADTGGSDTYAYDPAVGMNDNTAAGITNANAFCLTCHDGNGAAADVQIGNVAPPNVAANYATGGHGRPLASGAYTVSLNNPAYLKCTDCHEVHGSNHAKLLPAKKNETTANFTIPSNFPEKTFRSGGGTLLASNVDFTDYSSPASGKGFGTTGDPGDQHAPAGATTGFCDACHRFAGRANRGTDNVTNKAHAHEGIVGDLNQSSPSQMTFTKDCLECHDTHGTTNLEMVSTTINGLTPVPFTSRTGAGSFDPAETGSTANANSVCVVCHQNSTENAALNVAHNFLSSTVNPDHNEGTNCTACHPHGNAADAKKFGFPQAACNSCHGAASDTAGMPASGDTGVYHTDANNVIGTRGGDNTAHKIHVDYLVNKRAVARSSACYVCHVGGGSGESGGHPGNPTNKSFKTGTQPTAVPYVQVALDNTGAVLNVWNGAGTGPTYSGAPGSAADNTSGWKTCSNTKCHYALSPSWSGKQQITVPPGTMTVSTPDALPAAGDVLAGSTSNVADKIRLQTDATGTVTDNQFKVRLKAGSTAQDGTDITRVTFWEDVDNDNTVSAGDVQIGGNAVFSGTDNGYTVGPVSYSVVASTTKQILVVVDLAAGAVNGRTMTFSTVNGDITASYGTITAWTTFDSNQFTVSAPGTLTVSTPDALPAAGPVMVGSGNNLVDKINLVASGGFATVTGLKVKQLGTAQDGADITNISFWRDVNANGTLEPGTDTILGGAATFSAADNTYAVTGLSLTVSSGATERILVVDNVAAGATTTRTIQTQVVDATYVTLSAGTVAGTFPITASTIQTISSGGQLTVTTPDALPAAGDIRGASDNNVVDKITLTAATANVTLSGLWVKELGTSVDVSDVASVSFVDNTGGANTLLGTATYNSGDTTYRLTGLGLTVVVGTPRTILVMANIANGATAARTVQTQVNDGYVQVSTGTVNTITSFSSTIQTIRALTAVIVTDTAGSTTPVDTTNLSASGTHQFYATATYSNAALNQDATTSSAWSRAGTATGSTVGAATGLYTAGTTDGIDNVTATYRGQSDNTSVTVTTISPLTEYENFETGFIYWINVAGETGGLDWVRDQGGTPSNNTGPTVDKDPGTATGWYVYTEASSPAASGYEWWLEAARTFDVAVYGNLTLTFWYHMYGAGMGTLNVDINTDSAGGFPAASWTSIWSRIGQQQTKQTDAYLRGDVVLSTYVTSGTYKLRFRGVYGSTYTGDMALDAITVTNQGLPPAPPRQTGASTAIACNTCHQFGPDDATAGYKDSNQYFYAYSGSHAKHGVSLIGGTDPLAAAATPCVTCHGTGVTSYASDHMNGTINLANGAIGYGGTGTGTYTPGGGGHNGTCASVNCHFNNVTPAWGTGATTCTSCHNNGTNDGNINNAWPNTGKHPLHAAQSPTGYGYACTRCHPDNTGGHSTIDNAVQVTFAGNFVAGGTYDNAAKTCASTYCHSTARGGNAANVAMAWNGGAGSTAACGTCHGSTGGATESKKAMPVAAGANKHTNHIDHANLTMTCSACHNDASGTNGTYGDKAKHANGSIDNISISTTYNYEGVGAAYTAGGTNNTGSCANVLCHNGVATPAWNTSTFVCGACHNTAGTGPLPSAASVAGSHAKHANNDNTYTDCDSCHGNTTYNVSGSRGGSAYTVSGGGGGLHQNLAVDMWINGVANRYADTVNTAGGVNWNAAGATHVDDGTCSTTACHGSGTPQWGGTIAGGCFACHTGAEVANKPLEAVDGVPNPVDNTQYNSSGHGNSTTFSWDSIAGPSFLYSNTGAPNNGCYECHSSAANHVPKSATDPYRLGAWAANVDGLCNDCHGPSAANAKKALNALNLGILGHNKVNTGSARTWPGNYDYKCVDCHDPHGDGNYYLIRSAINNPANATDTNAGSDSYGTPKDNVLSVITFTSLTGFAATSYAVPGAGNGICEVCHNQTTPYNNAGSDNTGTHATRTGRCTTCHSHTTGFKGQGHAAGANCKGCHVDPQNARRDIYPATSGDDYNSTSTHGNTWANIVSADCEKCHQELSQDGAVVLKVWNADNATYGTATYSSANLSSANTHCLSCHDADGGPSIGGVLPTTRANVGQYTSTMTYNSHNYAPTADIAPSASSTGTVYNTTPVVQKAQSPHGKPTLNVMKGTEAQVAFTDTNPVGCLNCHPSHGSNYLTPTAYGISKTADGNSGWTTSSGGRRIGGNPSKLTGVGRDYANEGTPQATATASILDNFCWNCHDSVGVNDFRGDSNAEDVTASNAITHWQGTWTRPAAPFAYKSGAFQSSHYYPNKTGMGATWASGTPSGTRTNLQCVSCHDPHGNPIDGQYYAFALKGQWMTSPYKEDRVCNTPNTTGAAWIAPTAFSSSGIQAGCRSEPVKTYTNPATVGNGYLASKTGYTGTQITGTGHDGYFIDDDTFGVDGTNSAAPTASSPDNHNEAGKWPGNFYRTTANVMWVSVYNRNRLLETPDQFGGLCAKCHADSATQDGATLLTRLVTEWSGHGAVKGATVQNDILSVLENQHMHAMEGPVVNSGTRTNASLLNSINYPNSSAGNGWAYAPGSQKTAGTKVKYHEFSCSKCHTPHASRLKRLMATNCLDVGYQQGTAGQQYTNYPKHRYSGTWTFGNRTGWGDPTGGSSGTEPWHYTSAANNATTRNGGRPMHCHNTAATNTGTMGQAPSAVTGGGWNAVTGW